MQKTSTIKIEKRLITLKWRDSIDGMQLITFLGAAYDVYILYRILKVFEKMGFIYAVMAPHMLSFSKNHLYVYIKN